MQASLHRSPVPTHDECPIPESASTLVIVRLKAPPDVTRDNLRDVAEYVREHFVGVPGLERKYFSYSPERHEVMNVYVWNDCKAAARVRHPDFVANIRAVYGAEPDIAFADILAVADST